MYNDKIQKVLDSLPPSKEEVLELLKKEGIKGRRTSPCGCLIANLISKKVGFECNVGVLIGEGKERVYCVHVRWYAEPSIPLPKHLGEIAEDFDNGRLDPSFDLLP